MHEADFALLACPARHVVLSLTLLEFRIGHRLLLFRDRNPLICFTESHFNTLSFETQTSALIEAVFVCAKTFAERKRLETPCFLNWRQRLNKLDVRYWHKERKKAERKSVSGRWSVVSSILRGCHLQFGRRKESLATDYGQLTTDQATYWPIEVAKFRNYLAASRPITEWEARREGFPFLPCLPADEEPHARSNRSLGGPYDSTLIQFLLSSGLCRSEAECMEYPFGLAEMHYLTHLEREGALKIINAKEMQFESDCQAADLAAAKAAGFNTIAEHVAAVRSQSSVVSSKEKVGPVTPCGPPQNGLATSIPPELFEVPDEGKPAT